jgi:hypothetical protein
MHRLSLDEQRRAVIIVLALDRYLLGGGREAAETRRAFEALTRVYRGPSKALLDQFQHACAMGRGGQWMAALRIALWQEFGPSVWGEVIQREAVEKTTVDPYQLDQVG